MITMLMIYSFEQLTPRAPCVFSIALGAPVLKDLDTAYFK